MKADRRLWGRALVAAGIAGSRWGVLHALAASGGPERPDFAHRLPGSVVRERLHAALPGALARSLLGLAVLLIGARILARGRGRCR